MSVEAEVVWTGEMQFVGRAGDGPAVVMDTPEGGSGASPMELLLMGTAGCTAVDVISILKNPVLYEAQVTTSASEIGSRSRGISPQAIGIDVNAC